MARYCDKCRQKRWPKTEPTYMGHYCCDVCGEITWCHQGPDSLEKQIKQLKELRDASPQT